MLMCTFEKDQVCLGAINHVPTLFGSKKGHGPIIANHEHRYKNFLVKFFNNGNNNFSTIG
jgi:hypothetical protein